MSRHVRRRRCSRAPCRTPRPPSSRRPACRRSRSACNCTFAFSPGRYSLADGIDLDVRTRASPAARRFAHAVCSFPPWTVTASTKKFGMSALRRRLPRPCSCPLSCTICGGRYTPLAGRTNSSTAAPARLALTCSTPFRPARIALVRHDLDVVEAEFRAVEIPRRATAKTWPPSDRVRPSRVGQLRTTSDTARLGRLDLQLGQPLSSCRRSHLADLVLDRLAFFVGDLEQSQHALALHRLAVERAGRPCRLSSCRRRGSSRGRSTRRPGTACARRAPARWPTIVRRDWSTTSAWIW